MLRVGQISDLKLHKQNKSLNDLNLSSVVFYEQIMLLNDLIDSLNDPMGLQNRPADARAFSLLQFKKRPWDRGWGLGICSPEKIFKSRTSEIAFLVI